MDEECPEEEHAFGGDEKQEGWVTYSRCYLLTLSMLFTFLGAWIFKSRYQSVAPASEQQPWAWILILVGIMFSGGGFLFVRSLWGSKEQAAGTAKNIGMAHWATMIFTIVGLPLYIVLKTLEWIRKALFSSSTDRKMEA